MPIEMVCVGFNSISLIEVGHKITPWGAVYEEEGRLIIAPFPGVNRAEAQDPVFLHMTAEEWGRWLQQLDNMYVEGCGALEKSLLRKAQRHIDKEMQWKVWRRDEFRCRYCGQARPLTVDHVVTWEEGGPTIPENLISCCQPCNKLRGNLPYEIWLQSSKYKALSHSQAQHNHNVTVLARIEDIRTQLVKTRSR